MNNRDEHIVHSLRRWIQGDIDQKEENRLERQAREDAFLGEALEGYRQFPGSKHQQRLERMREQLQANTQQRKKRGGLLISMPYRIAAAAAVVLAVGLFWWLNPTVNTSLAASEQSEQTERAPFEQEASPEVAEEQITAAEPTGNNNPIPAPKPSTNAPSRTFADTQEGISSSKEEMEADQSPIAQSAPAERKEPQVLSKATDSVLALQQNAEAQQKMRARVNEDVLTTSPASPAPPPANDFAIGGVNLQAPQGTRLVTGQVLDRTGAPLNGVLVVTPGDRTGTITNMNGQYEILLDSTAQKLEFQANGYSPQRIDITDTRDFVRVTLDETAATLDQVIVAEEAAKKSKRDKVKPTVSASSINLNIAKPEISLRRFERQLQRNLQYPQAAIEQNIEGAVTLRFLILPDGRPVDIKALSGPEELYHEAIRLIQEGPKWEITNGGNKSVTFTYRLDFSF